MAALCEGERLVMHVNAELFIKMMDPLQQSKPVNSHRRGVRPPPSPSSHPHPTQVCSVTADSASKEKERVCCTCVYIITHRAVGVLYSFLLLCHL